MAFDNALCCITLQYVVVIVLTTLSSFIHLYVQVMIVIFILII